MSERCQVCGTGIERRRLSYRLEISLYADPSPPEFTEEDLESDPLAEMEALVREMADFPGDPEEFEAQVHEEYNFVLCPACRGRLHQILKHFRAPFDPEG